MVLDGSKGRVIVARVVPGGPAAKAGVKAGDQVLAVDEWKVPAVPKSAEVAAHVRGLAGKTVKLRLGRADVPQPVELSVLRGNMAALFPPAVKQVLRITPGLALIAVAEKHVYGVAFPDGGRPDGQFAYEWAVGPRGGPLGHVDVRRGLGVLAWSRAGVTLQVADWRLDLKPTRDGQAMVVGSSTRPVAVADQDTWLTLDPTQATYVVPRPPQSPYLRTWPAGPGLLRLGLGEKLAAGRRLSLILKNDEGLQLPSASTLTDDRGVARLALPAGNYQIMGLAAARAGGQSDLYFHAHITDPAPTVSCRAAAHTAVIPIKLTAGGSPQAMAGAATPEAAMFSHKLVGQPLPTQQIRRWLGKAHLPNDLRGKALLIYIWATWCGPCKRVSPIMAELDARMRKGGLLLVPASVDRDIGALEDFAAGRMAGAAAVAWLGPAALEDLPIRGIPTAILIDHLGVVRAVHTGTGMSIAGWQTLVGKLLDEAKAARDR